MFEFAIGSGVTDRLAPALGLGVSTTSNDEQALETGRVSFMQALDAAGAYDGAAYDRTSIAVTGTPASTLSVGLQRRFSANPEARRLRARGTLPAEEISRLPESHRRRAER